jgi:2-polyprenyl-3-methyl-5-hydroxy-6-metoxy-1,4-benzoquinol methylase
MYSDAYFDAYSVHHSIEVGYAAGREVAEKVASARLDRIMAFRRGGRLLDVGCAGGHFLAVARTRGYEVVGAEYNRAMETTQHEPTVSMFEGDFLELEIPGVFDLVHLEDVLEHVLDPVAVLRKVRQLVAPDGYVVIDGPLERQPNLSLAVLELNLYLRQVEDPEMAPAHIWQFTAATLGRLLETAGFREVDRWIYHSPVLAAPKTTSLAQNLRRLVARAVGHLSAWVTRQRSLAFLGHGDRGLVFYRVSGST